ncbi:hypothetical protein [Nocardia sp. BMG111209]|uniref:hypothetical protein n=1 Tax=Nocardia sp. BMG111209 TaxID=1160137 RepID=UPI0012DDDAEF|nr:hypothetical protein [Nocardia sp. BMG111209]
MQIARKAPIITFQPPPTSGINDSAALEIRIDRTSNRIIPRRQVNPFPSEFPLLTADLLTAARYGSGPDRQAPWIHG